MLINRTHLTGLPEAKAFAALGILGTTEIQVLLTAFIELIYHWVSDLKQYASDQHVVFAYLTVILALFFVLQAAIFFSVHHITRWYLRRARKRICMVLMTPEFEIEIGEISYQVSLDRITYSNWSVWEKSLN